jgi:hypothetical protein
MTSSRAALDPQELAQSILTRMAADVSLILDREFVIEPPVTECRVERPAGRDLVHISFKLGVEAERQSRQGCLLVPLPDAIALAAFVMMLPDEEVARDRQRTDLDGPFKEALLEVGKYLACACDSVLRRAFGEESSTRSNGCQGVRADVRPALSYREGDPLIVARARARVHHFEAFELILILPALKPEELESISG